MFLLFAGKSGFYSYWMLVLWSFQHSVSMGVHVHQSVFSALTQHHILLVEVLTNSGGHVDTAAPLCVCTCLYHSMIKNQWKVKIWVNIGLKTSWQPLVTKDKWGFHDQLRVIARGVVFREKWSQTVSTGPEASLQLHIVGMEDVNTWLLFVKSGTQTRNKDCSLSKFYFAVFHTNYGLP